MSSSSPVGSKLRSRVERSAGQRMEARAPARGGAAGGPRRGRRAGAPAASSVWAMAANWRGVEAAAAGGPLDGRPDVVGAADPGARTLREQGPDLARSPRGRSRRGPGRRPAASASARRRPGGKPGRGGQPLADQRELEEGDRLGVHQPARPAGAGDPGRPTNRHGAIGPARPGVGDADARAVGHDRAAAARPARRGSRRRLAGRIEEVDAVVVAASTPKAAARLPGPDGEARVRHAARAGRPRRRGRRRSAAPRGDRARQARRAHGRARPAIGAAARRRTARRVARRAGDDVEAGVHAVDTVHVGVARRAEHRARPASAGPNRACEARSSGPA